MPANRSRTHSSFRFQSPQASVYGRLLAFVFGCIVTGFGVSAGFLSGVGLTAVFAGTLGFGAGVILAGVASGVVAGAAAFASGCNVATFAFVAAAAAETSVDMAPAVHI